MSESRLPIHIRILIAICVCLTIWVIEGDLNDRSITRHTGSLLRVTMQ